MELACCTGHDAPVMDFVWADGVVASGDRSGMVRLWDTRRADLLATLKGHKGHITAMLALPASNSNSEGSDGAPRNAPDATLPGVVIATGAQDGHIRIWDVRQRLNTFNTAAHPGGAVNDLGLTFGSAPPALVSVGADGRMLVLEPRSNFLPLFEFSQISVDFIYSLLVLDDIAFTGDGRGRVVCFDIRNEGSAMHSMLVRMQYEPLVQRAPVLSVQEMTGMHLSLISKLKSP